MRARRRRRFRLAALLVVAAVSVGAGMLVWGLDAFRSAELDTVDARFSVRGTQTAPKQLVIVEVDGKTFSDLDEQWPFPRSIHADAIDRIARDRPRAIAYDIQFTEPTEPAEDEALIAAVEAAGPGRVVLGTTEVDARGRSNIFGDDALVREIGARPGSALALRDPAGVIRRYQRAPEGLTNFAVATAETARGRPLDAGFPGEDGSAYIDFRGPPGTIETVSFSDVVRGRVRAGFFRDRIAIVGAGAPSLQDLHPTSTSGDELMTGAEVQANAIHTALAGNPLHDAPAVLDVLAILLLGLVAPFAALRLAPGWTLVLAAGVAAGFLGVAQLAFNAGLIVPVVPPLVALALAAVGTLAVHYTLAAVERERVREHFIRYVPEAVVDDVLARTDEDARLGGVRRECTVMFTDLRGFTAFSEQREPDQVITVLNRYLGEVSDAIALHGGTLIAYLGDGVMAIFGAPLEQPDHADRALAAAREIVTERLPAFNAWMREQGLGEGFRMGVGLNTGAVMAGNVGSRAAHGVHGDRRHDEHRLAAGGPDQAHRAPGAAVRSDPRGAARGRGGPCRARRVRGPRADGAHPSVGPGRGGGRRADGRDRPRA